MRENPVKIKICGLKSFNDIAYANELKPDFIGFVFAQGRRRTISFMDGKLYKEALLDDISAVGVFVDEDINTVARLLNEGVIDIAQLHGDESEDYIKELHKLSPDKKIIKAFVIKNDTDVINAEKSSADMVLLDAGQGSGKSFDLSLIKDFKREFFLAGGLNEDNILRAYNEAPDCIYGLDLSSGVETNGSKDYKKIKSVIEAVRRIEHE